MDQQNLQILVEKIKIAPEYILREYYEMVILQAFSESDIAQKMIFYGGTALRLAYNGTRFSEDLDFLMIKKITASQLKKLLENICKKYPTLTLNEVKMKRNTLLGVMKIRHQALKHPRHIKIEICKKNASIQSEYRLLHSDCSNFSPLIQTITIASLEKAKIEAIKERKQPRDWFDLWLLMNIQRKIFTPPIIFPFQEAEFKRELKRFLPKNHWPIIDQICKHAISSKN